MASLTIYTKPAHTASCYFVVPFQKAKFTSATKMQTITNVEIMKKYNYFFRSLESGICYATVLSVTQLFEDGKNKQKRTLSYLLDEAKKYKIDREKEFEELKEKHKESLEMLKDARDTYFAHREKDYVLPTIP